MSQSTDSTQPMPQHGPEATVETQVVSLQQGLGAQSLPVAAVPFAPGFHPERPRLQHLHRVLGRILSTPLLPPPDRANLHAYGYGIEILVRDDLNSTALVPFAALFGGTPTSEDRDSQWAESGRQRYAELLTVVDGVEVRVWSLTDLPVVEKPVAEPVAEAAEPEPVYEPAPAPQPEHPEAA